MGDKITIWTLNKASNLLDKEQDDIKTIFQRAGYDAAFGNRLEFMQDPSQWPEGEPTINLMPGTEYFVPIAPKCIGDLFNQSGQPQILQNINNYYTQEAGQHTYDYFWDSDKHNYKMLTEKYMGYYSILRKTAPNFLIGYSQGALVPRYLFWLAHSVFNEPELVKGVITISSPNFGSPLANPDNAQAIIQGFIKIIGIILGIGKPLQRFADNAAPEFTVDELLDLLKEWSQGHKEPKQLAGLKAAEQEQSGQLADLLEELYNWLGGLRNDPDNAFYDLNIFRMNNPYSVLASTFQTIPTGNIRGIISTDNSLKDILGDVVWAVVVDILKKIIGRLEKSKPVLAREMADKDVMRLDKLKTLPKQTREDKIKQIEEVINTEIMAEHTPAENEIIKQRIDEYDNGITQPEIAAYSHDFVIPSSYQLTVDNTVIVQNANTPNYDANHLSGSEVIYKAGRLNVEYVKNYLEEMLSS